MTFATTAISNSMAMRRTAASVYGLARIHMAMLVAVLAAPRRHSRRVDVYNILWAVVFGFATLNILSLAARRFEPNRRGLTFGELMAVLVVLLSIFLLGWELLNVLHIFPIKLKR
jgi:drug/metabolite transporter (DMT)-like permease